MRALCPLSPEAVAMLCHRERQAVLNPPGMTLAPNMGPGGILWEKNVAALKDPQFMQESSRVWQQLDQTVGPETRNRAYNAWVLGYLDGPWPQDYY